MAIFGLMTKREAERIAAEAAKAAVLENIPRWLAETADANVFNLPDPSVYGNQADLYRKLSWILSAVEIVSQFAATTPFSVLQLQEGRESKDIPNHPFEMLLRRPNPLDSRFEFLQMSFILYKLTGNCYWWLNRPNPKTAPSELWIIPSNMIIPIPDKRMYIRGYYYYPGNGAELILEPEEIIHFRRPNPGNRFVGLSAIESLAMIANGDLGMQEWNTKLFKENNARLPGIITFEQFIEDGVWKKIKEETRDAAAKRQLMMLRGTGQGGVQWLQNAVSQKEMEFLAGRKMNKDEIWNTLAPGLNSMLDVNSTEANSRTGEAAFLRLSVYPLHVMAGEKITNELLPAYGDGSLTGQFEDVRVEDRELKLREDEQYSRTHTIDEIRQEKYGDEPIGDERGKLLIVQVNAQSGGIQEPPAPPAVPGKPMVEEEPKLEPKEEPEEEPANKAALEELGRFRRWALKHVGKDGFVPYSEALPADLLASVRAQLVTCTSETAVKAVFDAARDQLKPKRAQRPESADRLVVLLETAIKAMQANV